VVRIITKVTAWYADPVASRSGYQLLTSNGRIEADLLDQLSEQLANGSTESSSKDTSVSASKPHSEPAGGAEPTPTPKFPAIDRTLASASASTLSRSATAPERSELARPAQPNAEKSTSNLQAEARNLEDTLKNTAHPKNLVAVKKSGTPVVATPSLNAKAEFLASLHDEFELLDFNADWVHVRISGLSRGWIWRNSVEMPEGIPNVAAPTAAALVPAADLFHVIRQETSTFPGTWEALRNKNVKIITVQKIDENAKDAGAKARLEYAKFLLEKTFREMAGKSQDVNGVVVIFDSADGGMIAATAAALREWTAGTLSDSALWHKCFFDPPETFDSSGFSASQ
jgi:hypothetical protein